MEVTLKSHNIIFVSLCHNNYFQITFPNCFFDPGLECGMWAGHEFPFFT